MMWTARQRQYVRAFFLLALSLSVSTAFAFDAFITMRDGYFFDASTGQPWVPRGIAYQTWNRPLGVWQTHDQIDYDLDEMKKMGANSIRVDFVWQHIEEDGDNQFKWDNYDYLVQAAEARGIRIFALIGYQWPPNWFPNEWYTMHPPNYDSGGIWHGGRWQSDIINYEHPDARAQYAEWFGAVCSHFKTNKAIVAWIVGNEYGFLGLWSGLLDGYDPWCEQAFRNYCQAKYTNIAAANARWGGSFTNFNQVTFPDQYRAYGLEGAIWADAVQWRENSIGDFTAMGARAAKAGDTNHLISYSTVGMQWGEEDWRYHAEDRGKITAACLATNAAIDFFSVNNYPWSILGHESQNGQWGISYTKKVARVPVLYSETGFTSSETLWPGMNEFRQGPLIRNSLWESLEAGAIGTHIFAWHDRPYITDREKGFGILYANRVIKPAFWKSRDVFTLMGQIGLPSLLAGSTDPAPDIAFLWTAANDSQYNRYECEMQQIAGGLERLGYEPNFMNIDDLGSGAFTNYKVIILPRNMRVDDVVPNSTNKTVLDFLRTVVLPRGIHVIAGADLPGMQDFNGRARTNHLDEVKNLFGVDASDPGGREGAQNTGSWIGDFFRRIEVRFTTNAVGPLTNGYAYWPKVWKYSDEILVTNGGVLWAEMDSGRNKSFEDSATNLPGWGSWGNVFITNWFPMEGTNHLGMSGDAGIWQDWEVQPFGRYSVNAYLRSNRDDPLRGGAYGVLAIEWYDKGMTNLGTNAAARLYGPTPGDAWVQYKVDAIAPSNAENARLIVRIAGSVSNAPDLVANNALSGTNEAPDQWGSWNNGNHMPDTGTYLSGSNSWAFWWDSGIYQPVSNTFIAGDSMKFSGYLRHPGWNPLRNGDKYGAVQLEFYSNATLMATYTASPIVNSNSTTDTWIYVSGVATAPVGVTHGQMLVRCGGSAGDGWFFADDVSLTNLTTAGGLYVDNKRWAPALVVKDHGAGKAALFLYSFGDMSPDGDNDSMPDVLPWQWRYNVYGAVISNYFGVKPRLHLEGTNSDLGLVDYRICTNGSVLMQIKNYQYDTNDLASWSNPGGGAQATFTVVSDLITGKTIRAFEQAKIIETNSDGRFSITLAPDGQEMLLAYAPAVVTNQKICQIFTAPSTIHPFGDQCYGITVNYDTAGATGLLLKVAFVENGDNGDGKTNEIYQILTNVCVTGAGSNTFWMWIPDPDQTDTDYLSTPQGGSYQFKAWLEDGASNPVAAAVPQNTALEWGIAPLEPVPTAITKGDVTNMTVVWEDMEEQFDWQNTPLERGVNFPPRVAVYRSTKTERFYSNQFDRVNAVCDWLESLGYESGNRQDLSFDNVTVVAPAGTNDDSVAGLFSDDMESGTNGWTPAGLWRLASDAYASPTNCWTYNNGTNYSTGGRNFAGLVSPLIALTNADTAGASLRFKSWYETEDTGAGWDRKTVQVSTDGTHWVQMLQVTGTNRQWVTHAVDLSAYAGTSIRIRFYFDTIDALQNQYTGWRIDDVEVLAIQAAKTDLFNDPMEATTNWTADGLWRQTGARSGADVSGTNRWVYNRDAVNTNYSTGARSSGSLLSPWINLANVSGAQLLFKSWYKTEDTGTSWDRKLVYLTTDGAVWTRILQVAGPAEMWTAESADLSAYAGKQVRLKFTFDTIDALNNGYEGWYLDDVRVATLSGVGTAFFSDQAEQGTNEWAASGLWRLASDRSYSASNSWAYNNGFTYDTGARSSGSLVSRWIDLSDAVGASLSFRSWYETEDAGLSWDKKLVYATTNGTDWIQLAQVSGVNKQWVARTVDLSAFAGNRIQLKFFFDSVDAMYNGYAGWYVDDIEVRLTGVDYLFADDFGTEGTNWVRAAGAANWELSDSALRARRIGNDDNIVCAGDPSWSNYTVGANIRYNTQGPYFNDAEIYARYQDRDNFVKVGIRNFYGFWRLKYTVRAQTNMVDQGWLYEFSKTNQPAEGTWYSLKVRVETNTYTVILDGQEVGSFTATNFAAGKIALGSLATQLGIWEPAKGYFFIDDDEYSYYSATEGATVTLGSPLNLDWGYLNKFFPTLILPGTYVMNDTEAANVCIWLTNGFYSLMATDGGVAMKDETGADDRGRVEALFGVGTATSSVSGLNGVEIGTNVHYTTLDYKPEDLVPVQGTATAWRTLLQNTATNLGTLKSGSAAVPALICNVVTQKAASPPKVYCFNYGVDTGGQLTNQSAVLAQRAFEWLQGQTYMLKLELKYVLIPGNPNLDVVVFSTNFWTLNGWGTNALSVHIPMDNVMTGTNLYWVMYTFPWNATNAWRSHVGFFSSGNDPRFVTLGGLGLQILGITDIAYAGRDWDMWVAYNTQGSNLPVHFGFKDKGTLADEDNFNDDNTNGWTVVPSTNITWSIQADALRAEAGGGAGGYSWITKDSLAATGQNLTIEYNARYLDTTNAGDGGIVYRGMVLCVSPRACGWRDAVTNLYTNNIPTTGAWQHIVVNVRDGWPYPRSDLIVDRKAVFLDEPIEETNWASASVGLLSPYYNGRIEWDNFRAADEEYTLTTQSVSGVFSPISNANFWASLPDYDPEQWEYEGTTLGGKHQWYIYFRGEGVHGYKDAPVFFSPRLMVEDPAFPTNMQAGDTVQVPIMWENLGSNQPCALYLHLENPFQGKTYTTNTYPVSGSYGSNYFTVVLPVSMPAAGTYSWSAFLAPTNAFGTNAWIERIGSDDTFRFDPLGVAVEPETVVWVNINTDVGYTVYSDLGIPEPLNMAYFTWGGAHDGDYTNLTPPEGTKCWRDEIVGAGTYSGWGVFHTNGLKDFSSYNFLKFWMKTDETTVKVQIEAPAGTQKTLYLDGMGYDVNRLGQWQEIVTPITNFGFASVPTNVYGSFLATLEYLPTRYAIQFVSTQNVWLAGLPGSTHGIHLKQSTNGGASWFASRITNYTSTGFYDIDIVDGINGWLVGAYNNVMATTNSGVDWELRTNGLRGGQYWYNVDFINSQTGWVCGMYGVAGTTDGGLHWTNDFNPTASGTVRAIQFLDANNGWAAGNNFMLRTTNGGVTWAYRFIPVTNATYWRDVYFVNSSTGWACGYYGRIGKTVDGGETWALVTNAPGLYSQYLYGMTWPTENDGWIVGSGTVSNNMLFTHDGGATWSNCYSAASNQLLDVEFLNPNVGFACGSAGWLVKTTNGAAATPTWVDALPDARSFYTDRVRWTVGP